MRRARYACPSLAQKIGSQLPKPTKVWERGWQESVYLPRNDVVFSKFSVIQALVALVHDPEPEHPLRGDLAEEYTKNRKKFEKNAEEFTKKYAERRPAD